MEIKQTSGQQVVDYMSRDYESFLEMMQRLAPEKLPEWSDYQNETDFGNVMLQLFAHMGDIISYYQDRLVNECFLATAQERRSVIQHLKLIGYQLATATPASTELTLQFPAAFNDTVTVDKGAAFASKSTKDTSSVRYEYVGESIDIDGSILSVNAETNKKHYTIDIEEGQTIFEDVLGESDGTANQRFQLSYPNLILRSVGSSAEINVDISVWTELGGVVDDEWQLQETLAFSREDKKDYMIEIDENDEATIVFGGGGFGAVVPSNEVIKARYRIGGGAKGNLAAETITTIVDAPSLSLAGAKVINEDAATGGADRESIEHAVDHAPAVFRSLKRAVTAEDYEALARNFNGVGKVRAEVGDWNRVNLFVAPEGGGRISDILIANLLAYFEDKRPLSTLIEIQDVDYVKIYVSAKIGIGSYYSKTQMQEKIGQAVSELLMFDNVDFGQIIYLSKFYEAIEAIEGVKYVTIREFKREGEAGSNDEPGKIQLRVNEIPRIPGSAIADSDEDQDYVTGVKILTLEGGY